VLCSLVYQVSEEQEGCIKDGENILNIENVMQRDAEI
jgi:hypothetical protein